MFNKQLLKDTFHKAEYFKHPYVFIEVLTVSTGFKTVTVISAEHFKTAEDNYSEAFDEDLKLINDDDVVINGLSFGDSSELDHNIR